MTIMLYIYGNGLKFQVFANYRKIEKIIKYSFILFNFGIKLCRKASHESPTRNPLAHSILSIAQQRYTETLGLLPAHLQQLPHAVHLPPLEHRRPREVSKLLLGSSTHK